MTSSGPGVRFAAAVMLLLASIAVNDKVTDGELRPSVIGRPASWVGGRWRREALRDATALGFDVHAPLQIVGEPRSSLLVDGLHRTGRRIFAGDRRDAPPPKWVTGLLAGCAAAVGSCGVCTVCVRSLEGACTWQRLRLGVHRLRLVRLRLLRLRMRLLRL